MNKKNSQPLQEEHTFDITLQLEYLLFLPNSYDHLPDKKWPMIIFLHGAGERGNNLEFLKKHGIPKIVEKKQISNLLQFLLNVQKALGGPTNFVYSMNW